MAENEAVAAESSGPLGWTRGNSVLIPPLFQDWGVQIKDVFNQGYHYGMIKLVGKTTTESGVDFKAIGISNMDTSSVSGSLEAKYKFKDGAIQLTEKWTTENTLHSDLMYSEPRLKGFKFGIDTAYTPETSRKVAHCKGFFKMDYLNMNGGVKFDFPAASIRLDGAIVVGYQGWGVGYSMNFDSQSNEVTNSTVGAGYCGNDFVLLCTVNEEKRYEAGLYHKAKADLEWGVQCGWTSGSPGTLFAVAARQLLGDDASLSAKFNNAQQVGLGYTQRIRDGIIITFSGLIEAQTFSYSNGGHKLGLCIEFIA